MTERYIYRCAACGNTAEIDFPDGEATTHPKCCGVPVPPTRDTGPLFWLQGGDSAPLWVEPPRPPFEPRQSLYEWQWLYELIDGANLLKTGKVVLSPKAAVALCGGDHREADPLSAVKAAIRDAHATLIDRFESADPKVDRTLADWWAIAKAKGLDYHPHFDAMMLANGFGQGSDKAAVTDPAKPIPVRQQQEEAILLEIAALKYTATALPQNPDGKPGVRAEVRKRLPRFTGSMFEKAWQRLLDDKRIAYKTCGDPAP
ncbi:hypothetical protein [Paraburkholderia sp. 40]|uniref:hypothetical protein n=1 Tax=Paraburkholderia sp. 40 TaxID=2991059 RepID=UPI003D2097D8